MKIPESQAFRSILFSLLPDFFSSQSSLLKVYRSGWFKILMNESIKFTTSCHKWAASLKEKHKMLRIATAYIDKKQLKLYEEFVKQRVIDSMMWWSTQIQYISQLILKTKSINLIGITEKN